MTIPYLNLRLGHWDILNFSIRDWLVSQITGLFIFRTAKTEQVQAQASAGKDSICGGARKSRLFVDPKIGISLLPEGMEEQDGLALISAWDKVKKRVKNPSQTDIYGFLMCWFYENWKHQVSEKFNEKITSDFGGLMVSITEFLWERELEENMEKGCSRRIRNRAARARIRKIAMQA
ncbi:hypothetical protein ACFL5V_01235 [Fibrobacterota bacterium]